MKKLLIAAMCFFSSVSVYSQEAQNANPTAQELEDAKKSLQKGSQDAFNGWLMAKDNLMNKQRFNFGNMPVPDGGLTKPNMIQSILAESEKLKNSEAMKAKTKIVIFATLSMPQGAFDSYVSQINKVGYDDVTIVIRGLLERNNMKKTVQKIKEITKGKVAFEVDPSMFKRFDIQQVPALIVYEDDPQKEVKCAQEGKNPDDVVEEHLGVYGDVSISYALEYLARSYPSHQLTPFIESKLEAFQVQ